MKKAVLPLLLLCMAQGINAQEQSAKDYNKWTVEFGGGINKVSKPLNPGYHVDGYSLYTLDLGARYMFNTKFGLKLDVNSHRLMGDNRSIAFQTDVYTVGLEGVANIGRIMEFESWTKRLNILAHTGVGVGMLTGNDRLKENDNIGNFLIGLTGELKLTNRVTLTGDFTMMNSFSMQSSWDGGKLYQPAGSQGFDGTLYAATVGLNISFGKHAEHADWYVYNEDDKFVDLENRVSELETMMNDVDKDGVPDYLDAEPNTPSGALVDSKGRNIDLNNNGIADYAETKPSDATPTSPTEVIDLINEGYVNIYFDFNSDQPTHASTGALTFLITYLREHSDKSAELQGYADEVGSAKYNQELSERRAATVKKIFADAGIAADRLTIVGKGVDNSVNKDSKIARQTVRRVTLTIK
jgi:OOP family OmpA-OmpF porin